MPAPEINVINLTEGGSHIEENETRIELLETWSDALDEYLDAVERANVNLSQYGIAPHATNDQGAQINEALALIDEETEGQGVTVRMNAGYFRTGVPIEVPARVVLKGAGKRATIIKATDAFPPAEHLIYLDNGDDLSFDTRLEHLWIDCNERTGSSGVRVRRCQEGSGGQSVIVSGFKTYGWDIQENSANMWWNDLEFGYASNPTACFYVAGGGPGGAFTIKRITIDGDGTAAVGLDINAGVWNIVGGHFEACTIGLKVTNNSQGVASGLFGSTDCVTIVDTNANGWSFQSISLGSATHAVTDQLVGVSVDDAYVVFYTTSQNGEFHLGPNKIITNRTGDPEGVYSARVGSLYLRADGGSGTTLYVKESGSGNTGWTAK